MGDTTPTESEFNKLGHEVYDNEPEVVKKFLYVLKRPSPTFEHFQFISLVQMKFCEARQIDFWSFRHGAKLPNVIQHRRDFISAIVYLFNPEVLTGYSDVILAGLAEEIRKSLNVDRTWISQEVGNIKRLFKEKKIKKFEKDKEGKDVVVEYEHEEIIERRQKILNLAGQISVGLIEVEQPSGEVVSLFKDQTG